MVVFRVVGLLGLNCCRHPSLQQNGWLAENGLKPGGDKLYLRLARGWILTCPSGRRARKRAQKLRGTLACNDMTACAFGSDTVSFRMTMQCAGAWQLWDIRTHSHILHV